MNLATVIQYQNKRSGFDDCYCGADEVLQKCCGGACRGVVEVACRGVTEAFLCKKSKVRHPMWRKFQKGCREFSGKRKGAASHVEKIPKGMSGVS